MYKHWQVGTTFEFHFWGFFIVVVLFLNWAQRICIHFVGIWVLLFHWQNSLLRLWERMFIFFPAKVKFYPVYVKWLCKALTCQQWVKTINLHGFCCKMDYGMVCINHSWHNTFFSKLSTPFVWFKGKKSKGNEIERRREERTDGEEVRKTGRWSIYLGAKGKDSVYFLQPMK